MYAFISSLGSDGSSAAGAAPAAAGAADAAGADSVFSSLPMRAVWDPGLISAQHGAVQGENAERERTY